SRGFQGQMSYTFSKAMDASAIVLGSLSKRSPASLEDPEDRNRDRALSDWDSRHKFVGNFSLPLPARAGSKFLGAMVNGWTFDGIATFVTGLPFTATLAAPASRNLAAVSAERPNLKPGASNN